MHQTAQNHEFKNFISFYFILFRMLKNRWNVINYFFKILLMKPRKYFPICEVCFLFRLLHPLLESRFIILGKKTVTANFIFSKHLTKFSVFFSLIASKTTERKLSKISTQKTYIVKSSDL